MDLNFLSCPRIICKAGSLSQVGDLVCELGGSRVLLVTDPGIVACGFSEQAMSSLGAAGIAVEIFDRVAADPPMAIVSEAVGFAKSFGADAIIGLGGGSSLDRDRVVAVEAGGG